MKNQCTEEAAALTGEGHCTLEVRPHSAWYSAPRPTPLFLHLSQVEWLEKGGWGGG